MVVESVVIHWEYLVAEQEVGGGSAMTTET